MRCSSALLALLFGLSLGAQTQAQTCTGLACQQTTCSNNGTTSITGNVFAPNGTDPLPNVTVYIPNAPVDAFTPGVSCPVVGAPPSGSPLIGTTTAVDGSFTLTNVPVGTNIPLVIVSGRWRRQLVIPTVSSCTNTALPASFAVMPQNQSQGDIPLIAIASGEADQVECVLLKMGINQSEFTDAGGSGRINIFGSAGTTGSGVTIDAGTPSQASLMANASTLNNYDVLMLPCEGKAITKPAAELANLVAYANAGGRVYSSHFSYSWMFNNPPFNGVASWSPGDATGATTDLPDGTATVNTSFTAGQTLQTWLQEVGATTTPGQMAISTLREDQTGVIAPTQSWLTLNDAAAGNPVMQFVFDTPIGVPNQCGRVLYDEYHVENSSSGSGTFPSECALTVPMTPQEKLLEYSLFELTDEGGQPSLAPTSLNFGNEAFSFTTPPQTFTWTNNSSFASQVSSAVATGDFSVSSNNCSSVAPGTSCQINVVFTPSALGARSGTLTVTSSGNSLTAALTGTGIPGYSLSATTLAYGNLDIGASATQKLTLTNNAPQPLPVPPFLTTGQFTANTAACGSTIAGMASCTVTVTFGPTFTGAQSGALGVNSSSLLYSGLTVALSGTGVDFALSLNPTSGSVVAGDGATTTATLTPIAGFAFPLTLSCNVASSATASSCGLPTTSLTPTATTTETISVSTTAQYNVVGYGGLGGRSWLWLLGAGSGWLLWRKRRNARSLRSGLLVMLLAAIGLATTGCSGKLPQQNSAYTGPGNYVVTVSATDGFLVHSATYTLTVTSH